MYRVQILNLFVKATSLLCTRYFFLTRWRRHEASSRDPKLATSMRTGDILVPYCEDLRAG